MLLRPCTITFIDFDDTFFDTTALKHELEQRADVILPGGRRQFCSAYESHRGKQPEENGKVVDRCYVDLQWVCRDLARTCEQSPEDLCQYLFLQHDFPQLLLPGAVDLLRLLREHEIETRIVTQGDDYQHIKIEKSGIGQLVSGIETTDNKPAFLRRKVAEAVREGRNVCLIDDKPEIIELAKSLGCSTIWVQHGKYAKEGCSVSPDLIVESPRGIYQHLDWRRIEHEATTRHELEYAYR